MAAGGRMELEREECIDRYHGMKLWKDFPFGSEEENLAYSGLFR